ncbi:Signal peptidase complex-like protein DTM1 [Sesamum angolense]|uniref:Signal peptidase complex-like protein DTM1 n=3 Tax=Sesamum TaxID=4181 RepID=A0AAE2BJK1_9LAMI|nr:Signal peptidase complex-like protein DTM1 [Sesamum angolense]
MGNDAVLRTSLVWLAAIMVFTGLYTQSLKKMAVTYLFGMLAIGGVVLPDWKFFDRPVSQWCTLVTDDDADSSRSAPATARKKRRGNHPLAFRTVVNRVN